jgi:hypothetical protein
MMKDRMKTNPKMPNLNDHEAVQRFFIQEVCVDSFFDEIKVG